MARSHRVVASELQVGAVSVGQNTEAKRDNLEWHECIMVRFESRKRSKGSFTSGLPCSYGG